jgi:uncharacterized protein (TIGR02284 family)
MDHDSKTLDALDELMQTLEDGAKGYAEGADKLEQTDRSDLSMTFRDFARQRREFHSELQTLAAEMGQKPSTRGSVTGALHRGWMAVKDMMSGDDPSGVLDAAEQGEDHALKSYRNACDSDLDARVRAVVERQMSEIAAAHAQVKQLRDAA